jgi:hypothetical protein
LLDFIILCRDHGRNPHQEVHMSADLRKCFGLCCMFFALVAIPGWSQQTGGSILGTVKDASQAVLPGVTVAAIETDTGVTTRVVTDATGQFRFLALPVGPYRIEVTASGFQKSVTTNVVLTVNEQRRVDVAMQVGNISEQIEVTSNSVQVETTNTQMGQVVNDKSMMALPLNGRSFVDLLGLQAGVAPSSAGTGSSRSVGGGLSAGNQSVNGQREQSNSFLVNGGDVGEGRNFGTAIIPNLDSVAEFRLITNSFDAEYGRFSGAIMNAITKNGTNGFHGTAFEFLRNKSLDARGFFDPKKADLKRNQFGYAVGGPMVKNKAFWFTDYQGTRQIQGASTGVVPVPTVEQRAGTFSVSDLSGSVSGPNWAKVLSQRLGTTVTAGQKYSSVFPNGVVPTKSYSPAANGTLKYVPLPNSGPNRYSTASANRVIRDDKMGQRVDLMSQKFGNWFVYYHYDESSDNNPMAGSSFTGFPAATDMRAQQAVLSNIKTFGAKAVNEARVAFMRMSVHQLNPGDPGVSLNSLGFVTGANTLGIVNSGTGEEAVPRVTLNNFNFGRANPTLVQANNTWTLADGFSRIHGNHTLKFGAEGRYLQINGRNFYLPNGGFTFDGSETGSDILDYFLGAPSQYIQSSLQVIDTRTKYFGAYGQDSWRARPNLTLNFGLRWEFSMPWYDIYDRLNAIIPGVQSTQFPTAPKGWLVPGDPDGKGGTLTRTITPTDYLNLAPRVGLAWSPQTSTGLLGKLLGNGKTSIRASFGVYNTAVEDSGSFQIWGDAPYGLYWVSIAPPLFETPYLSRADGVSQTQRFPFVLPAPGNPANKTMDYSVFLPIASSPGIFPSNRLPYAEHYNLSIQRQLGRSMVFTMAYVGTQGHKLMASVQSNPGDPALCLSLMGSGVKAGTIQCGPNQANTTFTRPDGSKVYGTRTIMGNNYGQNTYQMAMGNSNYHSLQLSVERRMASLSFMGAYTLGKSIDNASAFGNAVNHLNFSASRALSSFDATHNFVFSYNYALPLARLFGGGPKRLVNGWSINGITRFATGFPITVSQTGDRSLFGGGVADVPNRVGNPVIHDPRESATFTYFEKAAFASGPLGGFGNASRRFFHGPGTNNWDFALHKDTRITEIISVQIRAEFFNAFNHAQFNLPSGSFTSSSFGRVTSARDPRIGQVSMKILW